MKNSVSKSLLFSVSVTATMMTAGAAQALTVVPTDLNEGDEYRLMFVTDGTIDGSSALVTDYNTFVTDDVTGSQLEMDLMAAGLTTDWFAISSTPFVSARSNTSTQGTGGVPIYLITGERVANNYGDLWDGRILTAIDTTPDDTVTDSFVWTGSLENGMGNMVNELGSFSSSDSLIGRSSSAGGSWINLTSQNQSQMNRLYGISGVLEVPQAQSTPEPSSLLGYITLGGFILGAAVRRARQ